MFVQRGGEHDHVCTDHQSVGQRMLRLQIDAHIKSLVGFGLHFAGALRGRVGAGQQVTGRTGCGR